MIKRFILLLVLVSFPLLSYSCGRKAPPKLPDAGLSLKKPVSLTGGVIE